MFVNSGCISFLLNTEKNEKEQLVEQEQIILAFLLQNYLNRDENIK